MATTEKSSMNAGFSKYMGILEKANSEISQLIRSEDSAEDKLMNELTSVFARRIEALKGLENLEAELHALEPKGVEFGYSHDSNLDAEGELRPILNSITEKHWYNSLNEAIAARANDLRWNLPTFIISLSLIHI